MVANALVITIAVMFAIGFILMAVSFDGFSACFARKQAKSHKCRIWCRLRGNTRCNQPLELD